MKTVTSMFMTIVMVAIFSATGMSQVASTTTPANKGTKAVVSPQGKFVDADKNGICDNHELKGAGQQGKNFTDKNGDGKCDKKGKTGKGKGNCCGAGQGSGNCCGKGHGGGNGCKGQNNSTAPQPGK